jgi:3-hydroxyisobutyrate dehydrogenase-like beta-hydroxyacid dehydrogenase
MNIGWIGLGGIGTEMVKRLLGAGQTVTAYTRGKGLAEVEAGGAKTCGDYAELAAQSDLLVICVYSDAQLADVLFDRGALAALRPGSILAIHTTGSPQLARRIGEQAPAGVGVLDATFSGGPADVAAGKLTLIVGGEAETLARARPVLETYAAQIYHVGPLGHGQTLKLLNNLIFATNLMNAVELLRLAESQGFDTKTAAQVIQASSGASYTMNLFRAAPPAAMLAASRHYMEKDVATAMQTAAELGLDMSAFAATAAYFQPG